MSSWKIELACDSVILRGSNTFTCGKLLKPKGFQCQCSVTTTTESETEIYGLKYMMLFLTGEHVPKRNINLCLTNPPPLPRCLSQAKSICYLHLIYEKQLWKLIWKMNCYYYVSQLTLLKTCFSKQGFTKSWHIQQEFVPLQLEAARKPVFNINLQLVLKPSQFTFDMICF